MQSPMRVKLSQERREGLVAAARSFFTEDLDRELSNFQAERVIDFFIRHLGAPVYNQAVQDVRSLLQTKLDDLDGELYEPEEPH
jgi:uncharacterized protein (DUF2164 family)